ncbi:MAG: dephospho-CoA kinase [Clostridia bacterium]|nr:dephospho-CoA kinase [Clostridia bacterium]
MGVKIAVYGGIGSGKSSAADIIRGLDYCVVDCDKVYQNQVLEDCAYRDMLVSRYGDEIVNDGRIDTRALGKIIYADKAEKAWLDSVAHPLIMAEVGRQLDEHKLAFAEVPLLYESGYKDMFDAAILITCDIDTRVSRLVASRYAAEGEDYVRRAAAAQASDDERKSIADYVVDNSGSIEDLKANIIHIIGDIKARFNIA